VDVEGDNKGIKHMWKTIFKIAKLHKKKTGFGFAVVALILFYSLAGEKGDINVNFLSILNSFNKYSHNTYITISMPTPSKSEQPLKSAREEPAEMKKPTVKVRQDREQKGTSEIKAKVEAEAVQDKNNHLLWQKNIQNSFLTWIEAQEYCKSLDLGGYPDWRLPTKAELEGLVDKRYTPSINPLFGTLPDRDAPYFWSGTPFNAAEAYLVSFKDGKPHHSKIEKEDGFVRCVRRG
jgi:hypothetical protein